jgi:hypothetical protein
MFIVQMDMVNPRATNVFDAKMHMKRCCVLSEYLIVHETQFNRDPFTDLERVKAQIVANTDGGATSSKVTVVSYPKVATIVGR